MIYSIYKITNTVNNKCYIGFTHNPKLRWKNHKNSSHIRRPLYESMKKHGVDNFTFEILYQSDDREHTLLVMEPYYIELYNSYNKGYNCTKGGLNTNNDEMRLNSSIRMKANNPMRKLKHNNGTFKKGHKPKITQERNDKIRESKLKEKNPNYGNKSAADHLHKEKFQCELCGKVTNIGNYKRWHGDNCRH